MYQYFSNLSFQKEGTPLITSMVNNKFVTLTVGLLGHWTKLPSHGVILHHFKKLEDLPFSCSKERLFLTLTHNFDHQGTTKISMFDLTIEEFIMYKILKTNVYPNADHSGEPSSMILVALYFLIKKIHVIWASLAMYNMGMSTKNMGTSLVLHASIFHYLQTPSLHSFSPLQTPLSQKVARSIQYLHGRFNSSPSGSPHGTQGQVHLA